jgi:hypothetical protein
LRGVLDDSIIDRVLDLAERVASLPELDKSDAVSAPLASVKVLEGMQALESPGTRIVQAMLCLIRAMRVAHDVLMAATVHQEEDELKALVARAVRTAALVATNAAHAVDEQAAATVISAARKDYEVLLRKFSAHHDVLGGPIDLSDEWWQDERGDFR